MKTSKEFLEYNFLNPEQSLFDSFGDEHPVSDLLDHFAEQFKPKFIPVTESHPEPNVRVRAIRTFGNGKMEEIHTHWVERTECFDDLLTDIITHWQYINLHASPETVIRKENKNE